MLRAVLDTNVFVSGTILSRGSSFEILQSWRKQDFLLLTSPDIIQEIIDVLSSPRFKKRYHIRSKDIRDLTYSLCLDSFVTPEKERIEFVREDPSDDKFLVCAFEGKADFIVSGDTHLLAVGGYKGIRIVSPRDFLKLLKERKKEE